MLNTLVSSKTKIKLLLKFFLNTSNTAYLRNLESEFGESTNSIRLELNKFEESGLLNSYSESNKKIFKEQLDNYLNKVRTGLLDKNIFYRLVNTSEAVDKVLRDFLTQRNKIRS